jgi:hypothetical protein
VPERFGDSQDIPAWARGKTKEEVLGIAKGYHEAFTGGQTSMPASAAPPLPPAPVPPARPFSLDPNAMVTGADLDTYARQLAEQQIMPMLRQNIESAANSTYAVATQRWGKEFDRYGPEINQELAKVQKQYWSLDNLKTVVEIVKGRHADDYARELAQQFVANMEPTIRPTGGGSAPQSLPAPDQTLDSEKIPAARRDLMKRAGITEATVAEFCRTNEMTREDFFKMMESPQGVIAADVSVR